jgi:tetratricopeptide (TPR) repeat protein/transcriptional regulator with XRE-family HTH domain
MPDAAARTAKRQRLAQRRKALGLTQEALAALLDVERSTVVRWERGETEPLPSIRPKLAETLRVSADRLDDLLAVSRPGSPVLAGVPHQLPAAVADFTGRAAELAALTQVLDDAGADGPGTVVISAIAGTAGVGKTALAVYWAHQVAQRFPDGQLYVNMRGFGRAGPPVTPADTLGRFLAALGLPADRVPSSAEARADAYRSMLADKRMLIVLDNAADAAQVRPLLPGGPGCLVAVTSRSQLTGLVAAEGARPLILDVLSEADARELLARRIGPERAAAEGGAIGRLAEQCARLPLALVIAAARAALHPGLPLAGLVAELEDASARLDALEAGDAASSVRTVFSWSYHSLSQPAARMFRLLGVHLGPDITVPAAASLAGLPVQATRLLLNKLTGVHLLTETVPGRFAFHDLLRFYATERARAEENEAGRDGAIRRVLDHYLHAAHAADRMLAPARDSLSIGRPGPGVAAGQPGSYQEALAWFEAEHQVLLAAVELAQTARLDVYAWQIPWVMVNFFDLKGHWHDAVTVHHCALAAAGRTGDRAGQARTHRGLSAALIHLDSDDDARAHLRRALRLYTQLGDRIGQARVHLDLARVVDRLGRRRHSPGHAERALRHAEQALELLQAAGHQAGQGRALNSVGWYRAQLGDYQLALARCSQAVRLCHELGDLLGEAAAWDSLGFVHRHLGAHPDAIACYHRAIDLTGQLGGRYHQADALAHLGDTHQDAGDPPKARGAWLQALAILDDLGHPDTCQVRARLGGPERK